jgi:hypothetical protein
VKALFALPALSVLFFGIAFGQEPITGKGVGTLHTLKVATVEPESEEEQKLEVHVGDLIQISAIGSSGVNDKGESQFVKNLKVTIAGRSKAVEKVAVVQIPQVTDEGQPVFGANEVAVFLVAKMKGDATVTVVPEEHFVGSGKKFLIKVTDKPAADE